jgi:Fur family ferric uptake transcriptional regulator
MVTKVVIMDIKNQLKDKGIKQTKHKIEVLKLFNLHKHLDAIQIFTILTNQNINISLATVYRILASLEYHSIIQKHHFNDDQSTYELMNPNDHHDHMICLSCKKVTEFMDYEIEELQNRVASFKQFQIVSHSLNIYGFCKECQHKK